MSFGFIEGFCLRGDGSELICWVAIDISIIFLTIINHQEFRSAPNRL